MLYTVRPGDSLWSIAQRFSIPLRELVAANPQVPTSGLIYPGSDLRIPQTNPPQPVETYIIQPGDTFYLLATRLGITTAELLQLNPGLTPTRLRVGQRINIPAAAQREIVIPREGYGYDAMLDDLVRLEERYPFLAVTSIGESVLGRPIPAVRVGVGPKEVHYNGSFHALEWITTPLLMKFIERYAEAYSRGENIGQFNVPALYNQTTLWVVPMVNPDGVELQQRGLEPDNPYAELVLEANQGSTDFSRWAANIRGVDLNNQFPALWELEAERGAPGPAPRGYPGPRPLSEPETQAMARFTEEHDFRLVMAFHSQGQVIFWGFEGLEPPESEFIVRVLSEASGYTPIRYVQSWAGYKDWFIQEWGRPGFTIEVGRGVNPLPIEQFWPIWSQNIGLMLAGLAL